MSKYLTEEKIQGIFQEYGGDQKNTGSEAGQVALFTFRIQSLADHLKENKKDHSCRRALLTMVGKRRRLLRYIAGKDIQQYRDLIEKLGIRK